MNNQITLEEIKDYYKKSNLPYLITVFVNSAYQTVLANWILFIYKCGIFNFCIVCLDKPIFDKCQEYNLFSIYYPVDTSKNLHNLWIKRVELLKYLILNDIPIIHSDLDAIWINNPFPYFKKLNEKIKADIIGSQGLIFPEFAFHNNGFIMCCGFFAINPTNNSKKWMEKWLFETKKSNDDQIAFNNILTWTKIKLFDLDYYIDEKEINYSPMRKFNYFQNIQLYNKNHSILFSNNPRLGINSSESKYPIQFILLPMSSFQRVPIIESNNKHLINQTIFIKHYFTQKTENDKINLFQKEEIWDEDSTLFFTPLNTLSDTPI